MFKFTVVLAVAAFGVLSATNVSAQSDRIVRASIRAQHAGRSQSPYAFMDTVGYPQEWHPSSAAAGKSIAPRRTVTFSSAAASRRTSAGMISHAHQSPRSASMYSTYISPGSSLPPAITGTARSRRVAVASREDGQLPATTRSRAGAERETAYSLRHNVRPIATERVSASKAASGRDPYRPYAFMDTVGFPEQYDASPSRSAPAAPRRTGTRRAAKTTKTRSRLEPGYVEIH